MRVHKGLDSKKRPRWKARRAIAARGALSQEGARLDPTPRRSILSHCLSMPLTHEVAA